MAASMTPQVDVNVNDAENRAPLSHPKYVKGSAWGRGMSQGVERAYLVSTRMLDSSSSPDSEVEAIEKRTNLSPATNGRV